MNMKYKVNHKPLFLWEDEPPNKIETDEFPTYQPSLNSVSFMALPWKFCRILSTCLQTLTWSQHGCCWFPGIHDDVVKWKHFPCYWPFVRGFPRWPLNSPHKGQWYGTLMFSLICDWINSWKNNCEAGDFKHIHAHYDIIVMCATRTSATIIMM